MKKGRQIRNGDSYLKNHRYTHQKRYLPAFFAPLKKKKNNGKFSKTLALRSRTLPQQLRPTTRE